MKTAQIDYTHGKTALKGFLAYDGKQRGRRPAVLVAHAWGGRDAFACAKAESLAALGYAGFAVDMYGDARLGKDKDENASLMTPFLRDRVLLQGRIGSALEAARRLDQVDPERVAAIGFCFGGLCVLDLARSGADARGVVSFHGLLGAPEGLPNAAIKAKIMALHGWDDPMATPKNLRSFAEEMTGAKADWQAHAYGNTMHAFTNPEANDPGFGTVYDEKADRRSWAAMTNFLEEIFAE